ncbi:uncharacterized protein LOC133737727 [Rosa rugosa]|uniref:uncharacterized protein LOC133737727 n=1 Tax=Rosa rugosa TaxID=74645 RepID=UPI002B40E05E|nr:uncharacterized protein LOC133737727 [Rosa rugosa]
MAHCGLIDMGFSGSRFTWSNKFMKERLDRNFQSVQWRSRFPYSRVVTLSPNESDHCPLLIEVSAEKISHKKGPRRFQFEEIWHGNEMCSNIIQQEWATPTTGNAMRQLGHKIQQAGKKLMQWHSTEFDKQKIELRIIQEKLYDIMKQPYSPEQYEEQRLLHIQHSSLLAQQERYWRQRFRAIWLKYGDRNSAFFHRRASNRKSRNTIKGLVDEDGVWQNDPSEIKRLLMSYFTQVFSTEGVDRDALNEVIAATPVKVTDWMNAELTKPYTDEEIRTTLFQMHPSKSPGPDGMTPFFYQKYWNIVSLDVCTAVRNLLTSGEIWNESNFTHLCLIPKIKDPKDAKHFRPIALCNVICRISSKVVANRLKYSILIQGEPTSMITPTRGIRQGDPLSSYLFILCAEGLSALISKAIESNAIEGLKMCPHAPTLHHLFFADDSFLFGTANEQECIQYRRVLNVYENASRQQVNFQKSSVVFSNNVLQDKQMKLADILQVKCVKEHDRYLGLPLRVGRSKTAIFAYIKEKLSKKLISWKSNILSSAGKETLIKVVAQTMPLYAMNCYLLPKGLCDDIHQLCASFFLGDTEEKKKSHWRSWERLCLTKHEGGMGFKNIYGYNLAMLAKQGWRLIYNPNSLIAQLYKARYYLNDSFWEAELGDAPSFSWRSILQGRPVLHVGIHWRVGDGCDINIWRDKWIPNCAQYLIHKPPHCTLKQVSKLIDVGSRSWKEDVIRGVFPSDIADKILCIPLSMRTMGHQGDPFLPLWKRLWQANIPGKVQICLWRACNDLLPTKATLLRKGYTGDTNCLLCLAKFEDKAHIFCKCPTAQTILSPPPFNLQPSLLPSIDFKEWMLDHALNLRLDTFDKLLMVIWALWKNKNNKFGLGTCQSPNDIVFGTLSWLDEFRKAQNAKHKPIEKPRRTWKPDAQGRWKVNIDGSFLPNQTRGGLGGVLHDAQGSFKAAFVMPVQHVAGAKQVELLALKTSLELLQAFPNQPVVIETNCLEATTDLANPRYDMLEYAGILDDITLALQAKPEVQINFAPRLCNMVAHRLASLAFEDHYSSV